MRCRLGCFLPGAPDKVRGQDCAAAFGGLGAIPGWSSQGFQQQAPLPLPRRSRPAAVKRNAGPFSLCPTSQFRFAWRKIESFSKTGPAPNASGSLDHHGLLLGLPYFKQIRHIQRRFAPKRFFSLDRARPRFSFWRPKKRNGGCIPVRQSRTSPRPARGRNPSPLVRAPQQIFRGHSKIIRQGA